MHLCSDGAAVAAPRLGEIGVEDRGHLAHKQARILRYQHAATIELNDPFLRQLPQTREGWLQLLRACLVPGADGADIDREFTHQALDQLGTQPVAGTEPEALGRSQIALQHPLGITADDDLVLDIAIGKATDRRGAETDQRFGTVGGVALEIAVQGAIRPRLPHGIIRQGKVIEADAHIASGDQRLGHRLSLFMAGKSRSSILR